MYLVDLYLLDKMYNLLLSRLACKEVIDVGDDVNADAASEIVLVFGSRESGGQKAREKN